MYDELIKTLRLRAALWEKMYDEDNVLKQAADAIEELSKDLERSKELESFWEKEANEALKKFQLAVARFQLAVASKPRWIPVTERLPDDLQTVLVVRKDGGIYCWMYSACSPTDEVWVDEYANAFSVYDVTHWMPLPSTEGLDET